MFYIVGYYLLKEALNKSSMICQRPQSKKCDFQFAYKIPVLHELANKSAIP
jgi:hypothetical protein